MTELSPTAPDTAASPTTTATPAASPTTTATRDAAATLDSKATRDSVANSDDSVRRVFEREGWVHWPQLVRGATLQALIDATRALESAAATFERDTLVRGVFFETQSTTGKKGERAIFPGALRKITSPSKGQGAFARLRSDPAVLAALTACGLASPQCLIDQVNFKLPRVGTCFPYHQDEAFIFGDALRRVQQFGGINLVIALDPADATNGGFEVLGRTHLGDVVKLSYDVSQMNYEVFDLTHRVVPTLAPGDAILFHPRLAHGSEPNRSERPRRLVTLWYGGGEPC
jgi:phytanoyl-CoA hydroxylase